MVEGRCSVDACDETVRARGLCDKHYRRWLAGTGSTCSVDGCSGTVKTRGWCKKHYLRWWKYGDPLVILQEQAEDGAPQEFIEMALNYQDKEGCLFWPYGRSYGYAILGGSSPTEGSNRVSRIICEKVHGPPTSPAHEACHNCGKGHLGCVNPHHLRWDTHTGNMTDKIIHGTDNRGERSSTAILTWKKVEEIKALKGKLSGPKVGSIFGVSHQTIYDIWHGKIWRGEG